jgi:CheY-like chemotaxis protein
MCPQGHRSIFPGGRCRLKSSPNSTMRMTSTFGKQPAFGHRLFSIVAKTILVVDDHPGVCTVASLILKHFGCRVLTANNGEQAMKVARGNASIDLLLADLEMLGMPGDEVAAWFFAARPDTPVVFMSGNPNRLERSEPCYFVENPFIRLETLVNTIREALYHNHAAQPAVSAA